MTAGTEPGRVARVADDETRAAGPVVHILLVEDNGADVFLVEKGLRENGIVAELHICEDGASALEWLSQLTRQSVPDAIILDLNLPRVEGVDVLRHILNRPALVGTPVMVFTSSASPSDRRRLEILGSTRYVIKPSGLDDFLRVVGENVREMLSQANPPRKAPGRKE